MPGTKEFQNIKFRKFQHEGIQALRDDLAEERKNASLSLADAVSEAVAFYSEHRKKMAAK